MRSIDWKTFERLRAAFLAGATDYWQDERDLENYDATFAQRIGWKWDYVLGEAKRRGWSPPAGTVLDWGCGTGIASRKFLEHFPGVARRLYLCDRSPLAMKFAARQVRDMEVWHESVPPRSVDVLLISHVLTEQVEPFTLPCEAKAVVIVEPGTYEVSRRLIALRERLRGEFNVVAPCTHQSACGMLAAENERHWCHHFAPSPPQVFMDGDWARFAKLAGIDLRSLPVSYLALDRRQVTVGGMRMIGRPRVYKAHALVLGCDASGVRERRVEKRTQPEHYRNLKKGTADSLWLETKAP
jgi:SAM-dependent methyltransferase